MQQQARSAMDQAERRASTAGTPSSARDAVKDAQRAVDAARRTPGPTNKRASLVRDLERKLDDVKRAAERVTASHQADEDLRRQILLTSSESDRLSRTSLGVAPAGHQPNRPASIGAVPNRTSADSAPAVEKESSTLSAELSQLRGENPSRQQLGDFCEAVAAGLVALVEDHGLLSQHYPGDDPHGIDILAISPDGQVQTFEVKGTARQNAGRPQTSNTKTGRQGGADWLVNRSASGPVSIPTAHAVGPAANQVASKLIQVNIRTGEISMWSLDAEGRTSAEPDVMYPLDDVVAAIDGS